MNSAERKALGLRLATIRGEQNLSQKEMGDALGVSWRSYQNYELGLREPTLDVISGFCEKFSINTDWLIFGDGARKSGPNAEELRRIICEIDQISKNRNLVISTEIKADLVVRAYLRVVDGHTMTEQELTNYVELVAVSSS